MKLFAVFATIHVVRSQIEYFVGEAFQIQWRVWLNDRVAGDWLEGRAYYRSRFIDDTIDNPDQRIQQDVDEFVRASYALCFGGAVARYIIPTGRGVIGASFTLVAFTGILWDLSGTVTVFGWGNSARTSLCHVRVRGGRHVDLVLDWSTPYPTKLLEPSPTANFRYALVRLRDAAENVAFYRGEDVERETIFGRFAAVIKNYWAIVFRQLKFYTWNLGVSQVSAVFNILFQAPRLFAGAITLGDLQQSANAFDQVQDSLSFFRENYDMFTYYRATLIRLDGMVDADEKSRQLPSLTAKNSATGWK